MNREKRRVQILRGYHILDTASEKPFDDLATLAAQICNTEYAQINFIDQDRQWTKASNGERPPERPRKFSLCSLAIQKESGSLIVNDTLDNEEYCNHPLVHSEPHIRFYAGLVLKSIHGYSLGTICVFDREPGTLTSDQVEALHILKREVETHLKFRMGEKKLEDLLVEETRLNRRIINNLPVNFFMYNSAGEMIQWNDNIRKTTGYNDIEISEMKPQDYFSEEDREQVDSTIGQAMGEGQASLEAELLKKDGSKSPFIFSTSRFRSNQETYLIGTGQDISEQKRYQKELQRSLREKEVLLAEVHHRVNNNLAIISGLIELEMMHGDVSSKQDHLRNTQQRIRSIALIHELLYKTENFSEINFDDVIARLIEFICDRYKNLTDGIEYRTNVQPMTMNVNQAIPCALIINELLTNASKHAFPRGRRGVVEVELAKADHNITLRVADNGRGLPDTYGPSESQTMGFLLVEKLCKQLKAEIQTKRSSGTEFIITFTKKDVKGTGNSFLTSEKIAS